jgi:hypothetical protein
MTKTTEFINLTHRKITLLGADGGILFDLAPGMNEATCTTKMVDLATINEVPVVTYDYLDVRGIPPAKPGVVYLVSFAVLQALNGKRKDVMSPDTSPGSVVRHHGIVDGVFRLRQL